MSTSGAPTGPPSGGEPIDPAVIERLRQSGIRIDAEGEFIHEGEPVRHHGLREALFRWLDRLPPPDGRHVLRLDDRRYAYVDVADTPLVARAARLEAGAVMLALSDGSEEALDAATLTLDDAGVLRCRVRGGRLGARLATSAAALLGDLIADGPDGPTLALGGRRYPLHRPPASAEPGA